MAVLLIVWLAFPVLGWYVAKEKGRTAIEGIILGALFGPVGCLIVAMLPREDRPPAVPSGEPWYTRLITLRHDHR